MSLSQGSFTRTYGAPQAGRDSTIPRFHFHAKEDSVATAAAGRPIFVQEERVQFIQPGNPNQPVEVVTDEHRQRWPDQYAAFKRGEEKAVDGTPLEQWPVLSRTHVLELKAMGIVSVEQCAALSDLAVQKIGLGGRKIRELAEAYLDDAKAMAITTAAVDRAEKAEALAASLQKQLAEIRPMLDSMHAELMALKNQPHPVATYIPGVHDPIQQAVQAAPPPPPASSSLDSIGETRRGPGRPRKEAA